MGGNSRSRLRKWASLLLPYALAAVIIILILQRYSFAAIRAEMAKGDALPVVPIALGTFACSLLFVAAADCVVLRGMLPAASVPSYGAIARGKAATVLLHIVHYALGHGAYATWMARKSGLSLARVMALISYIVLAELCSVCLYASAVITLGAPDVPQTLRLIFAGIALGLVLLILVAPFGKSLCERVVVLHAWTQGSRWRGIAQLGIRMVQHGATTTGTWLAARVFGLDIPFWVMLTYVPVILVVSSLPLNVAGFGAVQGAWLLLEPWAPGERILAFSVIWQLASCFALIVRGLPFVPSVLTEIRQGVSRSALVEPSLSPFPAACPEAAPEKRA